MPRVLRSPSNGQKVLEVPRRAEDLIGKAAAKAERRMRELGEDKAFQVSDAYQHDRAVAEGTLNDPPPFGESAKDQTDPVSAIIRNATIVITHAINEFGAVEGLRIAAEGIRSISDNVRNRLLERQDARIDTAIATLEPSQEIADQNDALRLSERHDRLRFDLEKNLKLAREVFDQKHPDTE